MKHFISIITKDFYNPIKNIAYILQVWLQFESRTDICLQAITVTDTYTSFNHRNKQIMLSLY